MLCQVAYPHVYSLMLILGRYSQAIAESPTWSYAGLTTKLMNRTEGYKHVTLR